MVFHTASDVVRRHAVSCCPAPDPMWKNGWERIGLGATCQILSKSTEKCDRS